MTLTKKQKGTDRKTEQNIKNELQRTPEKQQKEFKEKATVTEIKNINAEKQERKTTKREKQNRGQRTKRKTNKDRLQTSFSPFVLISCVCPSDLSVLDICPKTE